MLTDLTCVDSGANRNLCRDVKQSNGRAKKKDLVIGEAGMGHSFSSEAEGPIDVFIGGKKSSLLENTVFASKIFENILSVGEAVDRGFTMLFNKNYICLLK